MQFSASNETNLTCDNEAKDYAEGGRGKQRNGVGVAREKVLTKE